ncbi:hypothetical protein GW17_00042222 [Ensete ventricosum]|uniref:Uncharacterized protein n=1 Tax=Ensete ventricosum TaxID=4639 RepID=A0A426Y668_ENSVE|nr:hypothetical protein B296_00053861 [Ensete ventricosum]RWV95176.1 hypothetical protein GW17_00042222 [Ensete ventricosum]
MRNSGGEVKESSPHTHDPRFQETWKKDAIKRLCHPPYRNPETGREKVNERRVGYRLGRRFGPATTPRGRARGSERNRRCGGGAFLRRRRAECEGVSLVIEVSSWVSRSVNL